MSSEKVIAISNDVAECGKRVSDSKKRFKWRFKIGENTYVLEMTSSALSGKRIVKLNDQQIYSEQNVLNLNFDFIHSIEGHSVRIFKGETVNSFDCRIDNRSFEYLLKKKMQAPTDGKKVSKYQASNHDPFSAFSNLSISQKSEEKFDNQFGEFDDFDFSKPETVAKPTVQKKVSKQFVNFDFSSKKQEKPEPNPFETNNLAKLEHNMKNNQDLLSMDVDNFSTNVYGQYSNYLDLVDKNEGSSNTWGTEEPEKKKNLIQEMIPDLTSKQMINRTKMTAVELKKKAVDYYDSLI